MSHNSECKRCGCCCVLSLIYIIASGIKLYSRDSVDTLMSRNCNLRQKTRPQPCCCELGHSFATYTSTWRREVVLNFGMYLLTCSCNTELINRGNLILKKSACRYRGVAFADPGTFLRSSPPSVTRALGHRLHYFIRMNYSCASLTRYA